MYGREAPKNDEIDQLRNGDLALEPGDLLAAVAGPLGGARGRGSPPGADLSSGNLGRKVESQGGRGESAGGLSFKIVFAASGGILQ